jgi:hypothetical protein
VNFEKNPMEFGVYLLEGRCKLGQGKARIGTHAGSVFNEQHQSILMPVTPYLKGNRFPSPLLPLAL